MATLFLSYSHKDSAIRDELEIHWAALKRQGVIDIWHDRRIGVGKEFDNEIGKNLNEADIILLLMSPSGNGRKSLAFRRSLQVDHPLLPQLKLGV